MAESDPNLDAAMSAARALEQEGKLRIDVVRQLPQGKNNRVIPILFADRPAVLKFYADGFRRHRRPATERRAAELACLTHFAPSGIVPQVLESAWPDVLVLERLEGASLVTWLEQPRAKGAERALERMAESLGRAYGCLAAVSLDPAACGSLQPMLRSGRSARGQVQALIEQAQQACQGGTSFGLEGVQSVALMEGRRDALLDGPDLLYKYDNNTSNVLLRDKELPALVDFEQCLLGTPAIMLGALFDCLHDVKPTEAPGRFWCEPRLPWPAFRKGLESGYPLAAKVPQGAVLAGACLNNWVRVLSRKWPREKVARLRSRFARYTMASRWA